MAHDLIARQPGHDVLFHIAAMDVAADEDVAVVLSACAVVVDETTGDFATTTVTVVIVDDELADPPSDFCSHLHVTPVSALCDLQILAKAICKICLMMPRNRGLVISRGDQSDVVGVGAVPLCGRVDQAIEVVVAPMFVTELVLICSTIPFALHRAEEISDFKDRSAELFRFFMMPLEQHEICMSVVPVFIGHEKDASLFTGGEFTEVERVDLSIVFCN